jgi:hypothetical protein
MTFAMIDTTFDVRTDTPVGGDADKDSLTLRRYHQKLWSKPLPGGDAFDLDAITPTFYLHHRSPRGEFGLASDSVIPSFTLWDRMQPIVCQLEEAENEEFRTLGYTIGGFLVFPGNRIDRKMTINGARGFAPRIADRLDLTLECIRLHYGSDGSQLSPLGETLQRYREFFALFRDFSGYVEFFLLQDLVADDGQVKFFMDFKNFTTPAVPRDIETYKEYRRLSMEFVDARNRRIRRWDVAHPQSPEHNVLATVEPIGDTGHLR